MPIKSFWAIELIPGKEFTTTPEFDVHVTQAVLPAGAKDKERSLVTALYQKDEDEEDADPADGKPFTIASLKLDHSDSQALDLIFDAEIPVTFSVTGKNPVHLVGHHVPPSDDPYPDGFDSDDEDGLDELDDEDIPSQDEDEDEEDEEEDNELTAIPPQQQKKRALPQGAQAAAQNGGPAKKPKQEQSPAQGKQEGKPKQQQPQQQQQQQQKQQTPKQQTPQQQKQQNTPNQQKVRILQGGVRATILKEGTGQTAQNGRKVLMRYVGKLDNGKVFDAARNKPFDFKLGARQVIQGWDVGVLGMKEGEKRELVIPPAYAYGAGGSPPVIPRNATLTFEVELVKVL